MLTHLTIEVLPRGERTEWQFPLKIRFQFRWVGLPDDFNGHPPWTHRSLWPLWGAEVVLPEIIPHPLIIWYKVIKHQYEFITCPSLLTPPVHWGLRDSPNQLSIGLLVTQPLFHCTLESVIDSLKFSKVVSITYWDPLECVLFGSIFNLLNILNMLGDSYDLIFNFFRIKNAFICCFHHHILLLLLTLIELLWPCTLRWRLKEFLVIQFHEFPRISTKQRYWTYNRWLLYGSLLIILRALLIRLKSLHSLIVKDIHLLIHRFIYTHMPID